MLACAVSVGSLLSMSIITAFVITFLYCVFRLARKTI